MLKPSILNREQLTCLASPVRGDVFAAIRSMGEASAHDAAVAMGRSPESLHYHIKALLAANLIRVKSYRPTNRRPEAVYESVARRYNLPDLNDHPELASLAQNSVLAGLRQTMRGYRIAAERATNDPSVRRHLRVIRAGIRLGLEDTQTFFALIEKAVEFATANEYEGGVNLGWSSVVYPR